MNIGTHLEKTIKVSFEYEGEKVTLTVKEKALTPSVAQKFKDINNEPKIIASGLAEILVGWDVDYNDTEFPPTEENLSILPIDFLEKAMEVIGETWMGKQKTARKSANG